jgi:NADH dehydrogenase/NADH:ubiquinone oxidoreductase subunit G
MLQHVTLTIDGTPIRATATASVLDAALEYGICIPHLCHWPGLSDIGVCRLCIVEHIVSGRVRVTASCTLQAAQGMVIRTDTERIQQLRRNIAELLVAQAPNSRAIQDIAARCGVSRVRYPFRNDNCVQCGRCVRVCAEMWQARALGFVGRGGNRRVAFPFDRKPDFCKNCNTCIDLCPMTITPCPGPVSSGREYLCNACQSQLTMARDLPGSCVWCELGKGFRCSRWLQTVSSRAH